MRVGRTPARLVPTVAVMVATAVVAAMAISASGQHVQRVDTNNAALWVSNDDGGLYGRFNKASSNLELLSHAGEGGAGASADVLQDGNTVLAQNLSSGLLIPVDTATGADGHDQAAAVGAAQVDLRGGTLAVLDPASGKLWAMRTQGTSHMLDLSGFDPSTPPLAELGAAAGGGAHLTGLSVGSDGSVHAASVAGKQVTITPTELGFDVPAYSQLPAGFKTVQVAALGAQAAVLDGTTGTLVLPGGRTTQVPADPKAELQQGGGDVGNVAVATSTSLYRVGYDGTVTELFTQGSGAPAMPVNLGESVASGSCVLGAWAGSPGKVARSCNGAPATDVSGSRDEALQDPAFRVNWNLVVLNDRATGRIYDVDLQQSFNDWKSILALEKQDQEKEEKEVVKPTDAKPRATTDQYWARPDSTSVLHVLDNDIDPNGKTLSIVGVSGVKGAVDVRIAPDGQTLQYTQPKGVTQASFSYTIDNQHGQATATVTVAPAGKDHAPHLRENFSAPTFPVASAGNVTIPVLSDWRDDDGDPLIVKSASAGDGDVSVASDGQLEYTAPRSDKSVEGKVIYAVTDALSGPVQGEVKVQVLGDDETTGIAPVAQADAVRGEAGKPFTVLPLLNDIPGVDPSNSDTTLTLADEVQGWKGATITTDQEAGRVTILAPTKGVHYLTYTAAFGSSVASGTIRVDVFDDLPDDPVAMPDEAVIRGQQPITVDVLANDMDPAGGMLTVQTATPSDDAMLQVAVVRGRWLRIIPVPEKLDPNPQTISYTVTNGRAESQGRVTVSQEDALKDKPITRPDEATVRAGDSALVSVLANDLTLGGAMLTLDASVKGAPAVGELEVVDLLKDADKPQGDVGHAYVVGNQIRYVAPAKVDQETELTVYYYAQAGKSSSRGTLTVTVKPDPTDADPDSPPQPESIEARAVSGDTITIPIPATGQDPDGDSVSLVGLDSGPQLGQIMSTSLKGISYRSFPTDDSTGTDSFQYRVTDRYGQTGTGTIRVAIVPPGQTQVPIPVDDEVTARPAAVVRIDAMANDLVATSDKVTMALVSPPPGVELLGQQGPITATAPAAKDAPLVIRYTLTGNGGQGAGTILVNGEDGYVDPPRVRDQVATLSADGKTASVDLLANAWDPDGQASELRVTSVSSAAATLAGGLVTVPVGPGPQVLSYEVTDRDGATSCALIFVPASGDGLPYAKGLITLDSGASAQVDLADYVVSPRGNPLRITISKNASAAPADKLAVSVDKSLTSLKLTAKDYTGPAVVNLEVTDKESLNDPDRRTAWVSIPVQVGPATPVLRCPEDQQTIATGMTGKAIDLVSLCHVWAESADQVPTLRFEAGWDGPAPAGVTATIDNQSLTLSANGAEAVPGTTGKLKVTIPGTRAAGELNILVKATRKPRYTPQTIEVQQGTTQTGTIVLETLLQIGRKDTIISIEGQQQGARAEIRDGNGWVVTAEPNFYGIVKFPMVLSDVDNPAKTDRQIDAVLTASVYGPPAAPSVPTFGKLAQNHAVTLTWKRPDDHGATVDAYKVHSADGRDWDCPSETCTIKPLENNVPVTFQVMAHNKAGWGPASDFSAEYRPDQVPSAVTGFQSSDPRDKRITLSWNAVSGDFSPVTKYVITWGKMSKTVSGATSAQVNVGANRKTTFSIWAYNERGKSRKAARTTGWPTGPVLPFEITDVTTVNENQDRSGAKISWSKADPNGQGPTTYKVFVDNNLQGGCSTGTSCVTEGQKLDGGSHVIRIEAQNKPAAYPATKTSGSWTAEGNPDVPGKPTVEANGRNGELNVSGSAGNSRGPASATFVEVYSDGSYVAKASATGNSAAYSLTGVDVSTNRQHSITVKLCYNSAGGSGKHCSGKESPAQSGTPYGPFATPDISASANGTTVGFQVHGASANGRAAKLVVESSTGKSWTYPIQQFDTASPNETENVGYSRSVNYTAHLEPDSADQSRPNSANGTAHAETGPPPNPRANFETDGQIGSIIPAYSTWYAVKLTLSDYRPNSQVKCWVGSTQADLSSWSGTFTVDGSGHWGTARLTNRNSSGYLIVQSAGNLPSTGDCHQQ